jgi:hypothetical protein
MVHVVTHFGKDYPQNWDRGLLHALAGSPSEGGLDGTKGTWALANRGVGAILRFQIQAVFRGPPTRRAFVLNTLG